MQANQMSGNFFNLKSSKHVFTKVGKAKSFSKFRNDPEKKLTNFF